MDQKAGTKRDSVSQQLPSLQNILSFLIRSQTFQTLSGKHCFFLIDKLGFLIHDGVKMYQNLSLHVGIMQDKFQTSFHLIQNDFMQKIFCFESNEEQKIFKRLTLPGLVSLLHGYRVWLRQSFLLKPVYQHIWLVAKLLKSNPV